ncbi:DUF4192 domain-containing protein [Actinoplanes sp. Pm04-4]|uniref:DUF4192 domain-containing protein n=1 Tax=Paractinoplanes pyxinae TaxID=2997416 RepID=A0ABT4BEL3_9ACTN|nr:DUF4192 domain-containing protein [Actinoplanes pyxinae]MCY1144015.1 DUF4192 domain-containing protein [Actinoplanes pyxinae]
MPSFDNHSFDVHQVDELLDFIARLLGFTPNNSAVLVGITADSTIAAIGRMTLASSADELHAELRTATASLSSTGVTRVVLVGYGYEQLVRVTLDAVRESLRAAGIRAEGAIRVNGDHFWLLAGQALRATTPAVHYQPGTSAAAAAAVAAGLVALPDRETLVATLAPVTGLDREHMSAATAHAEQALATLLHDAATSEGPASSAAQQSRAHQAGITLLSEVEQLYRAGKTADDSQAASLSILLTVLTVRDAAVQRCSGDDWQRAMWIDLLRRAEPRYSAAPAGLVALCALYDGWGPLAGIALARALEADPGYRFAQLMADAMAAGVPPHIITDGLRDGQI